ncbi:MAG: DNA topoisomerase 3 [Ruminococcus sp.]|nr:DNA topoisomerase 3 [Ruminococcus sp.]
MQLIIAEKPSVAQSIAKVLGASNREDGYISGDKYLISWCVGHLVGLSSPEMYDEKYKSWNFETLPIIPEKWLFSINASTKAQFFKLKELISRSDVDELICATDAGREGECIFRFVYNKLGCKKPFKRLWVSSLEESAIKEGFQNLKPGNDYDNLFSAGLARAKADWLVGMNATRLFSVRYNSRLNIGRVQTPTLAMIVQRDYDIKHFIKQKYYTAEIDCGAFKASTERIDDEADAKAIAEKCSGRNASVIEVTKEIKTVNPPKLYDLTTLQREANRQYGYTAQQTLDYTQSLYEKKLCTYPRTDSQFITDDMADTALRRVSLVCEHIECCKGLSVPEPDIQRIVNNSKVSDHHALLPTDEIATADIAALPEGERSILFLISAKLVCAVASSHKYEAVKVKLNCENTAFSASGRTVITDGWKQLEASIKNRLKGNDDNEDKEEQEKSLPELSQGQVFERVSADISEHFTTPPKPFTEDTLLKAMETAGNKDYDEDSDVEKKGLGTPATRASIIEGLVKRGYLERKKKQLNATEKGINLIDVVPDEVKSAKMTADWESELQNIEKGNSSASDFMQNIERFTSDICTRYCSIAENKAFRRTEKEPIGTCPKCGKEVLETAKAYSCCGGKDGCGFIIWKTIAGKNISAAQAKKLVIKKKSDLIKGFKSKTGKVFDAYLVLKNDFSVGFEFQNKK